MSDSVTNSCKPGATSKPRYVALKFDRKQRFYIEVKYQKDHMNEEKLIAFNNYSCLAVYCRK